MFGTYWAEDYFCPVNRPSLKNKRIMSDHIENEGKKGTFVMWFFIYFTLFVLLLIYLYRYNLRMEF